MKPIFPLGVLPSQSLGGEGATLVSLLDAGWEDALATGIVTYDPSETEIFKVPPFCYHFLPGRELRPRSTRVSGPSNTILARTHQPCPFEAPDFLETRQLASVEREGRSYVIVCNKFPVVPGHFLAIRDPTAPVATLPQCVQNAAEVEDTLLFLCRLGAPFRAYFNSNRGADGSASGSSVNHWHIQFFRYFENSPSTLLTARTESEQRVGSLTCGRVADWPAHHVFVECAPDAIPAAAEFLYLRIAELNRRNVAYNLEAVALEDGRSRSFLFPRSYAPAVPVGGVGELGMNMGGCELGGHFVVARPEIFNWLRSNPREGHEIAQKRLAESTRPVVDPPNAPTYNAGFACRPRP